MKWIFAFDLKKTKMEISGVEIWRIAGGFAAPQHTQKSAPPDQNFLPKTKKAKMLRTIRRYFSQSVRLTDSDPQVV